MNRNARIAMAMVLIAVGVGFTRAQGVHNLVTHVFTHDNRAMGELNAVLHHSARKEIAVKEVVPITEHFFGIAHREHLATLIHEETQEIAGNIRVAGHARTHVHIPNDALPEVILISAVHQHSYDIG